MLRKLLLVASVVSVAGLVSLSAEAQCSEDCWKIPGGGYGCVGGDNSNCHAQYSSCWVIECSFAFLDEDGTALMIGDSCAGPDGNFNLAAIDEIPPVELRALLEDPRQTRPTRDPAVSAPRKD